MFKVWRSRGLQRARDGKARTEYRRSAVLLPSIVHLEDCSSARRANVETVDVAFVAAKPHSSLVYNMYIHVRFSIASKPTAAYRRRIACRCA